MHPRPGALSDGGRKAAESPGTDQPLQPAIDEGCGGGHPAPDGATIYHWRGGLLLLAKTLVLDRPTNPIAATLRIALREPYRIEFEDRTLVTRASLVGSKKRRKRVTAIDSDLALFYLPIERPEYAGVRRLLGEEPVIEIAIAQLAPVLPRIRDAFDGKLSGSEVKQLAVDTLRLIAPPSDDGGDDRFDPRIRKACELLAGTPLDRFDIEKLADAVHLSPSRLRSLFRQQVGHAIGEYARWSASWQAVEHWKPGRTFTEAALDAGFFDLAHAAHTIVEVFGMSPTLATDSRSVKLISCD